jgi:hypothetical protein
MVDEHNMRPHQRGLIKLFFRAVKQGKYSFIYGAQGTFKTTSNVIAFWLTLCTLSKCYTGLNYIVAAISYGQLKDSFLKAWKKEVPSDNYTYNKVEQEITLVGEGFDTTIMLRHAGDMAEGASAERASRSRRGGSVNGFYFPQAESLSFNFFSQIQSMVRGAPDKRPSAKGYPPYRIQAFDANPDAPGHFLHDMFINEESERHIGHMALVKHLAMTPESSAYTADEIATFRKVWSPHRVARMVDGLWVGAEGLIYTKWESCPTPNPSDIVRWWIGMDPGTSEEEHDGRQGNLALVWVGQLSGEKGLVVLNSTQTRFTGVANLANLIETVSAPYQHASFEGMIGDWGGGSGAVYKDVLPNIIPWLDTIWKPSGNRAKWYAVTAGITLLIEAFATQRLRVGEENSELIQDLRRYTWKVRGSEPDKKAYDSHLLDALRYVFIRIHSELG